MEKKTQKESPLEQAERVVKEKKEGGTVADPAFFEHGKEVAIRPDQLKTKQLLTLDITSIKHLKQLLCVTLSELYTTDMPGFDAARTPTPTACIDVQDIVSGKSWRLICNAVLASEFKRLEKPVIGRYFAIECGDLVVGKRYRKVQVAELERIG